MNFSISDLKKHLGPGLGLRKNKYLLEIPVPGVKGEKINVLCRSAGLPERNVSTTTIFHKGRRYNVRGEVDYMGIYEVSILDDSNMDIRKMFDRWIKKIDNSKPNSAGVFSGASYETGIGDLLDVVKSGTDVLNKAKNIIQNPNDTVGNFFLGLLDEGQAAAFANYQTDINVWQLSAKNEKVYGYKLQNAFPSSIGIVTLDDGDENTLSEFSVTFSFSEFIPLENIGLNKRLQNAALGDDVNDTIGGLESLFD